MATYVNDLRLTELATGEGSGTWGVTTNTNLELIGEALGYGTQDCFASDADATTTVADGATDPARAMYFKVTSSATLTATRTLTIAPNTVSRVMLIENATTGSQSIAISQGTGGNVTIASGQVKMVYLDGAGATGAVVDALADLELGTITVADLTATTADINGGTIDGATIATSDITVGAGKTLDVSAGTFTVANDQISGDAINGGTATPTTLTSTTVNATTVDTTNIELTNLKAKDGTAAGSIADSTGVVTLASSVLTTTDINGGTIDGVTIGGSSAGAITGTTITGTSFVSSGDMTFGDNDKAIFGAGSDLQIYHDGSNSYIREIGTGDLIVRATNLQLQRVDGAENYLTATQNGAVDVYCDGAVKLSTTLTGIDVTGTVTADGLTVDTGEALIQALNDTANSAIPTLRFADTDTSQSAGQKAGQVEFYTSDSSPGPAGVYAYINAQAENTNGVGALFFGTGLAGSAADRLKISSGGDISFYEDTGTTPKFFWDASAESLGIGTSSPSQNLEIASTFPAIRLTDTDASNAVSEITGGSGILALSADGTGAVANSRIVMNVDGSEAMRIDSSQNLLVGKTAAGSSNVGAELRPQGYIFGTGDGINPLRLNRLTSDGAIAEFQKDGTTVGSIGAKDGDIYIGTGDTQIRFSDSADDIRPTSTDGAGRDAAIDLGNSSNRFKDLYLSGGVYLGGTGADNLLDDYEEGTWTPVLSDGTNNATTSAAEGTYTKVGRQVTLSGRFAVSSLGSVSGGVRITGMPFAVSSGNAGRGSLNVSFASGLSLGTAGYSVIGSPSPGNTYTFLGVWDATAGSSDLLASELTASAILYFSIVYFTA